jgi:hypothetical protein
MRRVSILHTSIMIAILCGAVAMPHAFAQAPIFVLPSLDAAPTTHPASTPQPPPPAPRPASNPIPAPAATPPARPANTASYAPASIPPPPSPVARPAASNALPTPVAKPQPVPPAVHPATTAALTTPAKPGHHAPDATPELTTCRKRYADAVYNIGLALWTAPEVQHRALERLLNAAAAAQTAADDPNPSEQVAMFCADSTLNDLEATVVRLKAKGWVPLTDVEEHTATTTNLNDELKHAINGISK